MSSLSERPILIAGGGPVGVITALALARQALPVHVFEAETKINDAPRAATTHAATLEMLEELGLIEDVIRRGVVEPLFRIWDRSTGKLVAEFNFGNLKNDTRYPFAVQCEQHKLATLAIERLRAFPHATVEFSARVRSISQSSDAVEITIETAAGYNLSSSQHMDSNNPLIFHGACIIGHCPPPAATTSFSWADMTVNEVRAALSYKF
jgi:3-(3-hydroxy-phenyl)propionate hydroxylase